MMKKQPFSAGLTGILLGSAILACNFSAATQGDIESPLTTLAPPPTAEFQLEEDFSDSPYLLEEFNDGMPEGFNPGPGWSATAGILSVSKADEILEIAGDWQEFSLILLLRVGSGGAAVDFNISPQGQYQLNFSRAELSLDWLPAGANPEYISTQSLVLDSRWHNLVLTQKQGILSVTVDGETLLDGLNPGYSPTGYFRLSKTGPGTLEIDRLVIGPPR